MFVVRSFPPKRVWVTVPYKMSRGRKGERAERFFRAVYQKAVSRFGCTRGKEAHPSILVATVAVVS